MCHQRFVTYFGCAAQHDHTHVCKEHIDHTWLQKDTLPCPNTTVEFKKKFNICTCAEHPERVCKTKIPGRANDNGHTWTFDILGTGLKKEREDRKSEGFEKRKEVYENFFGRHGNYDEGAEAVGKRTNMIDFEVAVDEVIADIGGMDVDDEEHSAQSVNNDQLFQNHSDDEKRSRFKKRRTDRDYSIPKVQVLQSSNIQKVSSSLLNSNTEVKKFLDTSPKKGRDWLAEDDSAHSDDPKDLDWGTPVSKLKSKKRSGRPVKGNDKEGKFSGTRKYPSSRF